MGDSTTRVETAGGTYDVVIGEGLLDRCGEVIAGSTSAARAVIITDATVARLYGDVVDRSLRRSGSATDRIVITPGEQAKSWGQAGEVLGKMADIGLDRNDVVVALGGGVVGDLAGFCAATYMRGIDYVQVPTTLLAQVDSSVGGKTAVDLSAGKNLAGAFKQPRLVVADTGALESLPPNEWRSGLAEVAKSAMLGGEEFLEWMERSATSLVEMEAMSVAEAVRRCVSYKAGVVQADVHESGMRESLNYGHTLGHAIEKVAGFGAFPHGLAVADGMRFAARLAEKVVEAAPGLAARQDRMLDSLGLPRLSEVYDVGEIRAAMASDKKARDGRPRFVLLVAPGEFVVTHVDEDTLVAELGEWFSGR
jgi:3-dehydroquinate synthase